MGSDKRSNKPRSDYVYAKTNGVVDRLQVSYNPLNDTFCLEGAEPGSSRFVRSYMRDSGKEKIITSAQSKNSEVSLNPLTFLKQNFDHLVAVDTNRISSSQGDIAVAVAYYVPNILSEYDGKIPFCPLACYAMLNVYPGLNPEILGWNLVIQNRLASETARRRRIGLIVDSELGRLGQFNTRALPYIGSEFLPTHVQLLYATDAATDTIQNQMLRYCHNAADSAKLAVVEKLQSVLWSPNPYCRGVVEIMAEAG